jgi:hypothetical protein
MTQDVSSTTAAATATQSDPWQPYDAQSKGKGHHAAAPEPASWGLIGVGFALCVYLYVRFVRPHSRCCGGRCCH